MVCDYRKFNKKLPADFWSYDKDSLRIDNHGINAPYPLPHIDEMLALIRGHKFLMTLDCTGAFHGLSPDAARKSTFITQLGKFEWKVAPFGLVLLPSYYSKAMQDTLCGPGRLHKKLHGQCPDSIIHRKGNIWTTSHKFSNNFANSK